MIFQTNQGDILNSDNICQISQTQNLINITFTDGTVLTYTYSDQSLAQADFQLISGTIGTSPLIGVTGYLWSNDNSTWTAPPISNAGSIYIQINGTGFPTNPAPSDLGFSDSAGNEYLPTFSATSATQLTTNALGIPPAPATGQYVATIFGTGFQLKFNITIST
jgi:hypothetical protein